MAVFAWLVVERGEPFFPGTRIDIAKKEIVIGRSSGSAAPDLDFRNYFVSRRHCLVWRENDVCYIRDLGSKHGTMVNGQVVPGDAPCRLENGDTISLAMGTVLLRLVCSTEFEQTIDIGQGALFVQQAYPISLDREKRQCLVDGKVIAISGKEWRFLELLYEKANKLVTYEEIKKTVWSERKPTGEEGAPDVGIDELNVLIYRLRRKMGGRAELIKTVRGSGCIMEL